MTIHPAAYLLLLPILFQDPNSLSPEERAKLEAQNTALRTMLTTAPKLPLEPTPLELQGVSPEVVAGTVSWVTSDRNGLIYLIQRGDQIDPVIVIGSQRQDRTLVGKRHVRHTARNPRRSPRETCGPLMPRARWCTSFLRRGRS